MPMPLLDPHFSTRRRLKVVLTFAGVVAGAVFGIALTRIGKMATGAPPATLGNYAWNAAVFAALAGFVSPIVSWSVLRWVPLWRTIVEPLALAIVGGAVALLVPAPTGLGLFLILPPVGPIAGFAHLQRRYPDPDLAAERALRAGEYLHPRIK